MSPPPPPPPPGATAASHAAILRSVHSLTSYSDTLADFLDQWNSVLLDAASIAATFAALFPGPESNPKPATEPEPEPILAPEPEPEPKPAPNPDRERKDGDPSAAELGLLCERMSARGLRRFITIRLRDREWLRLVGPEALRRAPDPALLVLRAVGRYYICAESQDAAAACVLLLELYVRAGCPRRPGHGEAKLREEAREAALTWRSRLVHVKGRLGAADVREARGLALFMAAFGVPVEFPVQELYELLDAADGLACTKVLRCSKLFVKKMRDVVVEMINKDMYLQAIRIILAFEFQNAFPLAPTLTHIMEKVEHGRKEESEGQALKERDEEELTLLRAISKCVEDHKLCPSGFSSFSIAERIALLEERVGKPKQDFTGIKRKRTAKEDCTAL
ncbi:protein FRIGIDA [Phragmites australis]|uniref:protein FRIGIDA n=1 Tax=Phragmites australis TaxID=29695 RepID=UPI002D79E93A|nr:protein FRIGIDA [Phragmites australis]